MIKGCKREVLWGGAIKDCVLVQFVNVTKITYLDYYFLPILDHFTNNVSTTDNHFEHPLDPSPQVHFLLWTTSPLISEVALCRPV